MVRKRKLSGLSTSDLEIARDNALLDCAETGRGRGEVGFCEEGVKFAYYQVKKAGARIERIQDLLIPQIHARERCERMKVMKIAASKAAIKVCIGGSASLIARLTRVLKSGGSTLKGKKRRR